MTQIFSSSTAGATSALGESVGRVCTGRLAFLLAGVYGSGKTTFIQGLARGLGVSEPVRSPSYNILKIYGGEKTTLVHADLYRTRSTADINELGIMELLPDPGILAVEWPGNLADIGTGLPEIRISFDYTGDSTKTEPDTLDSLRTLAFELTDDCPADVREVILAAAAR